MKRTFIALVSAAVLLMAATACYDAIECPDVLRTNDKIKFVPEDNLLTKAPVTSFPTDFGIILSASHSSVGSYMVGIPFSRNSSNEWEPSTAKYWPQSGTLSFLGFAKKNLSVSNVSWNADPSYQVTMTIGDNSSLQEDLMFCAAATVDKRTTAYPLSFSHAMANLQFTVAAPDGAYNSSNNTGITVSSIKLVNVYNSGNVTATRSGASVSYAWSSLGNQKNLTAPGISNVSVATTATALGNGLVVVPQTCVGVQIEYVLHNGKDGAGTAVNTTRTYTYTPSGSWAAGSKYTIAFSISQGQVSATTSISAWTNATQNWFFGTGNTVSWVGNDFSFTSGNLNNIWWRLDGSSSYEPLTYVEGTWGSSVKLEAASYYVTLTASGSNYTVSYQTKRSFVGIRVEPEVIYLPGCGSENFADSRYSKNYATSNNVKIYVYAMYDDGTEEDVSSSATWAGNMPRRFYVDDDNYTHAANAYASSTCGGAVSVYRAYCSSTSANIYLGPPVDAYRYYFYNLPSLGNAPQNFITASYTEGKVTKTANVKATIINPALPVTLSISPASREAFSGGYTVNYTATVTLDDGSTKDVTSQAEWSADGLVISNGGGGFTTGNVNGSTTIRASYTYNDVTVTASSSLTLRDRIVNSIELSVYDDYDETWSSSSAKVEAGHNQSYRLRVVWEDGESWITSGFNLTSTNSSVISASGSGSTAVNTGSANVTATFGGRTSNTLSMTVIPAGEIRIVINISNAVNEPEGGWRDENYIYYDVQISYYSWIPSWELYGEIHVYRVRYVNGIIDTSWGSGGYKEITTSCYIDTEWNEHWYGPILTTYEYEGALYYATVDESIDMRDYVDDRFYLEVVTPYGTYWCYLDFYLP